MQDRHERERRGFTLIEMIVVILVICVLLAVAIPSFQKARESARTRSCLANMKSTISAKEQYAVEKRMNHGDRVTFDDLTPTYLRSLPTCPAGGAYVIGPVGENPKCSYPDHVLP